MRSIAEWWTVVAVGALVLAFVGDSPAQDKKPYEKHDASALNQSLRDVINVGAKMFNEQGDHAGCYRLYQGALLAVKPFLASDLQTRIDEGVAKAERLPLYADRAFELRKVLDDIRAKTNPGGAVDPKKGTVGDKGQIAGKLTFQGKAVAGGYFVTLIGEGGKKFSSAINKDGSFQFKTPIPAGEYQVAIELIPGEKNVGVVLPAHYSMGSTSGIKVAVQGGKQSFDLSLVK